MATSTLTTSEVERRTSRRQRTLKRPVSYSGIGIHTGQEVRLRFVPAKPGQGIFFKRTDLASQPIIPATIEYVFDTSNRGTNLAINDVRIYTIEHVMAAIRACEIDNLCIELSNVEPPGGNGSSDVFIDLIEEAGLHEEEQLLPIVALQNPVYHSDGDLYIVGLPADEYRLSYTLHYPQSSALKTQFHSFVLDAEGFKKEIAPCRTFALYEEISYLMDRGLIKGGSLDNAVVIKDNAILSKNGLFFENEMCRHKILDMIGDLSLIGIHFTAHIMAIRTGHHANFHFAQKLYHQLSLENR